MENIKDLAKGVGIDCNKLPDNLKTTIYRAILEKLGYDCNQLQDNLKTTLLKEIGNNIGTPIEIKTTEKMNELLRIENIGKIYKFVGETDGTYTNGELYQVVEGE